MKNVIEVTGLSKKFDRFTLEDIHFTLPAGYIMGLVGPNGAGKTTIIKLLLNMLSRQSGEIKLFGLDNIENEKQIKQEIGTVFDTSFFVDEWTVLQVEQAIKGFYDKWSSEKYRRLLEKFRIDARKKVKDLSRGMQMKLMLACALSHDAKLLILDEPTSGLDPVARDELLELLSETIADGTHSVLFSTHITPDLEKIADYITFVCDGRLYYSGPKDEFIDSFRLIKGGKNELTADQKRKVIGYREYVTGYEGLIRTKDMRLFDSAIIDRVGIDDIIVHVSKGGEAR